MIPLTEWLVSASAMVAAALIGGVALCVVYRLLPDEAEDAKRVHQVIAIRFGVALSTALIALFGSLWFQSSDRVFVRVATGTVLVGALASILFAVKIRKIRIYAGLEILFALLLVGSSISQLGDEVGAVDGLRLFAGTYLIVRGLDNFKKDLDERRAVKEKPAQAA